MRRVGRSMNSRTKGHAFEREIAREMTRAHRGVEYATTRRVAPHLDSQGIDVVDTAPLPGEPSFDVQCKVGARPNPLRALGEMADRGKIRLAITQRTRGNGRPKMRSVTMSWDDWLKVLGMLA